MTIIAVTVTTTRVYLFPMLLLLVIRRTRIAVASILTCSLLYLSVI